jgi:N-acyl-D-amino-acid deacylase
MNKFNRSLMALLFGIPVLVSCTTSNSLVVQNDNVAVADILIVNGAVYTGELRQAQSLNIAICQQIICGIYPQNVEVKAKKVLDAAGQIVSPGFIDPHTHSYQELISQDKNQNLNYLFQGVTTVINGNDGDGPVDIQAASRAFNPAGIGTNTAFLVGHGSLRRQVMGTAKRHATAAELAEMKALMETAMQQGALGLSSGLYYVPGSFATAEEVIELAKIAAKYNGIYDTHLRDESTFNIGFLAALDEAIHIARSAKIHLHIAHIKALGVDVWGQSKQAIDKINQARSEGVIITADQYPWQASGTNMRSAVVPKWAMADSENAFIQRLENPALIDRIKSEIKENIRRRGGSTALLITASKDKSIVGSTLEEIAKRLGKSDIDTVIHLVRQGRTRVASFNMHEDDIDAFMQQPWVVTSSDGTNGHPRKYASFPQKYQEYVLNSDNLDLPRFIHSSTGQTADILGLGDRGYLQVGFKADILVFEPNKYRAEANFKVWDRLSKGVSHLFVNGQHVIINGEYSGSLSGQFVARKED